MTRFWLMCLLALSLILGLGLSGPACSSGEGEVIAGSCNMEGIACIEYVGSSFDPMSIRTICADIGTYSPAFCPAGAFGKCSVGVGTESEKATYHYAGNPDTYEADCVEGYGTWTPLGGS